MKKILLVALMALCGASFSFGSCTTDCQSDCKKAKLNHIECKTKCGAECHGRQEPDDGSGEKPNLKS